MGAGAAPDVLMLVPVLAYRRIDPDFWPLTPGPSSRRRSPRLGLCRRFLARLGLDLQTRRSQQLAHIEQYHQPPAHLAQPGHAIEAAILKSRWRRLDRVGGNLQYLRSRIHD